MSTDVSQVGVTSSLLFNICYQSENYDHDFIKDVSHSRRRNFWGNSNPPTVYKSGTKMFMIEEKTVIVARCVKRTYRGKLQRSS